jgi:hypothetical protein
MDDHPRRVDDPAQARAAQLCEPGSELSGQISGIFSAAYLYTRAVKDSTRRVDGERIVAQARQFVDRGQVA